MAVGEHDIVAPGRDHDLTAGDRVVVRYGRPVTLTLDGERRQVWTTARTVDGALRQLGVRAEGAYLSASRSAPISRRGLDLDVRTERTVTFVADGHEHTLRTNAATVREAVRQAGIVLHGQDTASVDPDSFPRDGQTISIMRITGGQEVPRSRSGPRVPPGRRCILMIEIVWPSRGKLSGSTEAVSCPWRTMPACRTASRTVAALVRRVCSCPSPRGDRALGADVQVQAAAGDGRGAGGGEVGALGADAELAQGAVHGPGRGPHLAALAVEGEGDRAAVADDDAVAGGQVVVAGRGRRCRARRRPCPRPPAARRRRRRRCAGCAARRRR
ncbi:hypothetical protein GCM10020221_34180 [Streptomyces thioluteus]|uniref:DUF348 domain-containing protein n=1 Tax=Streptomyces thioluteus TaxID=66431 RepID=A0ABP6JKJ0_STRTU